MMEIKFIGGNLAEVTMQVRGWLEDSQTLGEELATSTVPFVAPGTPAAPTQPVVPQQAPAAPAQAEAPVQPAAAPVAPPAPVPVAPAPTFTREQIMTAGAALIDAGKMNELMTLLNTFGVQAVTQLKQEQLGTFATELRKLGAQI